MKTRSQIFIFFLLSFPFTGKGAEIRALAGADENAGPMPGVSVSRTSPGEVTSLAPAGETAVSWGRYRLASLAGGPGHGGHVDGMGSAARFDHPAGLAADAAGNIYVSETELGTIRKITPAGVVTTLAGTAGQTGSQDGTGPAARFNGPWGLAVDRAGNVYVADRKNHTIRKIDPAGNVTTIAGKAGIPGSTGGKREAARLAMPTYLAVDDSGNVYCSEVPDDQSRFISYIYPFPLKMYPERAIRKIAPDGTVSDLVVFISNPPETPPENRRYYIPGWPFELGVDPAGGLYAIYSDDWEFSEAMKLTRTANGEYEGRPLPVLAFSSWARRLTVDRDGNAYVKYDSDPLCRYTPEGETQPYLGADKSGGFFWAAMGALPGGGLAVLPRTGAYAEKGGTVEVATFDPVADERAFLLQPQDAEGTIRGSTVEFNVQLVGTPPYAYQWYFNSNRIAGATQSILTLSRAQDSDAGYYFAVVTDATGSVTSRVASLSVVSPPPPPPLPPPHEVVGGGSGGGGGAVSPGFLLALGVLFLARRVRRRGVGPVVPARPSTHPA